MSSQSSLGAQVRQKINRVLKTTGFEINRVGTEQTAAWRTVFYDVEPWVEQIIETVRPFTLTSRERVSALCHAVRYISRARIPGDIVECGVWRGGSTMAAAMTLVGEGDLSRALYLFDTFEGMTPPTDVDRRAEDGTAASKILEEAKKTDVIWANAPMNDVQANLALTGYPTKSLHFIKGRVEDTLPAKAPSSIAILRLDTDWYESTKHELIHLFPRLSDGGILIIDDYGGWEGARKAVDEYFSSMNPPFLLQRIDQTGRLVLKCIRHKSLK